MKKIIVAFILVFQICSAFPEEIFLQCQGSNKGSNIAESSSNFSIKVDTDSGDIWSYPSYLMGGVCVEYKSNEFISGACRKNETNFSCSCSSVRGSANYKLSRISLILDTSIYFKNNEVWTGRFQCVNAKRQL